MPCHDNVDVRVIVDGQPLQEYADPENEAIEDVAQVVYIEAVTGQKFGIQVKFMPGYELRSAACLYYQFQIDDATLNHYNRKLTQDVRHVQGTLTREVSFVHNECRTKDEHDQWRYIHFTFGALGITEEQPSRGQTLDQVTKLGQIKVEVFRPNLVPRAQPYYYDGTLPEVRDDVSEKLLKGRHIKNNTRYALSNKQAAAPSAQLYDYIPIEGAAGKIATYFFKYRNREILQHIGCIPRSPSPTPDHALMLERTQEMLRTQKEAKREMNLENLRLREQIERLRSGIRDRSTADISDHVELENGTRGIKRERNNNDDDIQELIPPAKRLPVIMDLTEDD